jgi:tRNA(Ile)-lysidine synthase
LDALKLPLAVRRRRQGDRFHPLGAAGEKKVGKFLTTAKVSETVRENALVFADARCIIWVCPVRISEQTRITEQTQRILMLRVAGPRLSGTASPT